MQPRIAMWSVTQGYGERVRGIMAVERPPNEGSSVHVNIDTLGGCAAELRTLEGLSDWSEEQESVTISSCFTFPPAAGFDSTYRDFAHQASQIVGRIERLNNQYADAVAKAVKTYGETDRHSAAALAAITKAMSAPPKGKSGSVNDF